MPFSRQQRRQLKRDIEKSKGKDVFFVVPDTEFDGFYLNLTLTKKPETLLSEPESEIYFSKYGVARFYNEDGLFLEIWAGAKRVRIGTQADIDTFIHNYYESLGKEVPTDFTTQQLILGYVTAAFAKCYQLKVKSDTEVCGKEPTLS